MILTTQPVLKQMLSKYQIKSIEEKNAIKEIVQEGIFY